MIEKLLVRVEEAAEMMSIGRSKAYDLVASGEWPSVLVGNRRRVPVAALRAWVVRALERDDRG